MARILYAGIPAHGHTNPTLPVVKQLVERGHEVLYYNSEEMREKIAVTGVDFRPYPEPMPTTREISDAMDQLIDATMILIKISRHLTAWMIEELRREQPDVVIYDSVAQWGYVAARVLKLPHVTSITHFVLDGSVGNIPLRHRLRLILQAIPKLPRILAWKRFMVREFGKENVGGITEYGDRSIVFTSREFHPQNTYIDARFRFVGPALDTATRDGQFAFERLTGETLVYISLGTINNRDTKFYRTAFEAFADYPAQFVMSVGKYTDIAALGPIPENFIVQHYVPQLHILQWADVFITHGGMNSTHEGLVYGVPEIVVPHQIEQLLNGYRVRDVGAGLLLGDRAPYGQVTADELGHALDTVLNDQRFQAQAQRYGQTLRKAGGTATAIAEIETFLAETSPQALLLGAL